MRLLTANLPKKENRPVGVVILKKEYAMKKGITFVLALLVMGGALFAQGPTTITATKDGDLYNVTITWKPADDWTAVELRGNYAGDLWGGGRPMTKNPDGSWTITIKGLKAGSYEYKFFADDTWMDEAENYPVTVGNPFGGVNGALIVDDNLVAGIVTKPFAPTVYMNLNLPVSFIYNDSYDVISSTFVARTFIKFQGYWKLNGEILPNLFFFTETNLHGLGNQITVWNEHSDLATNQKNNLRAASFFVRGFTFINNHYAELQKLFLEYRTDYVNISYSDGYYKFIPESYAGPFIFTMYGVDGTKDNNALMGTWRLTKSGLKIADGVNLDYMITWGNNARRTWSGGAIWEDISSGKRPDGGVTGNGVSWDDNKVAFYGSANYFQVSGSFGTIGLNLDFVSEAPDITLASDLDDFFTYLNKQFSIGYKTSLDFGSIAFQFATQMANTESNPSFEYSFGRNSVIGLKTDLTKIGVDGLSVGLYFALVGADYIPWRFYATSDEDKAGDYVGTDVANKYFTFKLQPKYSAGGITAGLDYKLQVANPTNKDTDIASTDDGDIYNDFKVYGGYSTDMFWANLYSNLKFNVYETTTGKNAFEFINVGLNVGAGNLVPGVLNKINLYYELGMSGQGTEVTTDDEMGNSIALSAAFASETYLHFGVGIVGGEGNSTVPNNKTNVGYSIAIQQAFPFMNALNVVKYHAFIQYNHGLRVADGEDQGKIGLSDYRINNFGTSLMNIYDKFIIGVWFDY